MKKIIITAFVFIAFHASAQKIVIDPNAEVRQVSGFHSIKVMNAIDLELSQSGEEAVAVSASKTEYRDKIKTNVENGVLKIWYDDDSRWWKNTTNRKLKAYVSFKTLNSLTAQGASDVLVTGIIKGNDLKISLSGASDFRGGIQANSLDMQISGASDASVTGTVSSLKIDASGASELKGYDLQTQTCNAEASGASEINISVNKELSAQASGASSIHYRGSGVIKNLKTGGASSVSKRG